MSTLENVYYNDSSLSGLKRHLANKELVLFLGSGLSHGSGLPDWRGLIEELMAKLGLPFDQSDTHDGGDLQKSASKIEEYCKKNNNNLSNLIKDLFDGKETSGTKLQGTIIKSFFPHGGVIITTNYDNLIERAAAGRPHEVYSYPYPNVKFSRFDFSAFRTDDKLHIFKSHGDCYTPGSQIILSAESYQAAYKHNSDCVRLLHELENQNVLFIGCSFADPYFLNYRNSYSAGDWYALYPTTDSIEEIQKALMSEKDSTDNPINPRFRDLNIHGFYYRIEDMTSNEQHRERIESFVNAVSGFITIREPSDFEEAQRNGATEIIISELLRGYTWTLNKYPGLAARLKRVYFDSSYEGTIPQKAFSHCEKLEEIIFPNKELDFDDGCFEFCYELKTIRVRKGDGSYSDNCFMHIRSINRFAFYKCTSLTSLDFSACTELGSIGESAFQCCEELRSITLPSSIKAVEQNAFRDCKRLKYVDFSGLTNCKQIGACVFAGCGELQSVALPACLEDLGQAAFDSDSSLTLVGIDNTQVKEIRGHTFHDCFSLRFIILPESLNKIADLAFKDCKKLSTVCFNGDSSKVEKGEKAFNGCPPITFK